MHRKENLLDLILFVCLLELSNESQVPFGKMFLHWIAAARDSKFTSGRQENYSLSS